MAGSGLVYENLKLAYRREEGTGYCRCWPKKMEMEKLLEFQTENHKCYC